MQSREVSELVVENLGIFVDKPAAKPIEQRFTQINPLPVPEKLIGRPEKKLKVRRPVEKLRIRNGGNPLDDLDHFYDKLYESYSVDPPPAKQNASEKKIQSQPNLQPVVKESPPVSLTVNRAPSPELFHQIPVHANFISRSPNAHNRPRKTYLKERILDWSPKEHDAAAYNRSRSAQSGMTILNLNAPKKNSKKKKVIQDVEQPHLPTFGIESLPAIEPIKHLPVINRKKSNGITKWDNDALDTTRTNNDLFDFVVNHH
jgi:hypothetical protein